MSQISETCGGGDAGRALVPGSLRGYRTWRLLGRRQHLEAGTLPLTSVTRRRVVWNPTLIARCSPDDIGTSGPSSSTLAGDHRAPQAGCGCGIYGWYAPTDTSIVRARVFGVIDASGLVLLGERGFRAEKAKITAVVTRSRRVTAACERAGIAVYRRRRDLLRDYPPEDLAALLGATPRPESNATIAQTPPLYGFDRLVFLAVWGRVALIASALVALPMTPTLVTAIVAQIAVISLVAARFRH
ncbi:MAG TPA: hypothetical protein VE623_20465 [Acidimicrobiales bacterium]|jgi:hypothetical protein|nr:hypothetical protein [Acidimicrobiales bacterium]